MIRYFKNQALIKCPDAILSLDYTYNADGDSMADFISDHNEAVDSMTDNLYKEELQQVWDIARNHTTSREYAVINHKYRDGSTGLSISRQRQHELEQSALSKLRRCKQLQELAGIDTSQTHPYYMGGFQRWKDKQESCGEGLAVENVLRERNRKRHKRKSEDVSLIEQELESFWSVPS